MGFLFSFELVLLLFWLLLRLYDEIVLISMLVCVGCFVHLFDQRSASGGELKRGFLAIYVGHRWWRSGC